MLGGHNYFCTFLMNPPHYLARNSWSALRTVQIDHVSGVLALLCLYLYMHESCEIADVKGCIQYPITSKHMRYCSVVAMALYVVCVFCVYSVCTDHRLLSTIYIIIFVYLTRALHLCSMPHNLCYVCTQHKFRQGTLPCVCMEATKRHCFHPQPKVRSADPNK